jgi:ferric-dicitrate binding protein FerR (iron transport regulator)
METDSTYFIDLIARYFAGEAGEDDQVFLAEWLKADPGNRKLFEEYRKTWMAVEQARIGSSIDPDAEWKEMEKRIFRAHPSEGEAGEGKVIRFHSARILQMAALLVLLAVPAWFLFRYVVLPEMKKVEATAAIVERRLPDGSTVSLNAGSVLEYPSRFTGKHRNIRLTGEAFFSVTPDCTKSFIVTGNRYRIEVVGTSFYVNTATGSGKMEVIVKTGKVSVYDPLDGENLVVLAPGEKAEIILSGGTITKIIMEDENYMAWRTKKMVFNGTPLPEIVTLLNKVYHSDICLTSPGLSGCLLTATFDNQPLESVLHVIQAALNVNITTRNGITEISGDGCR